jgi:hypothetical protein
MRADIDVEDGLVVRNPLELSVDLFRLFVGGVVSVRGVAHDY